ncbi:MAG: hypothetical protein WAX44_00335 [Minisyncoccia bacterium]
MTDLYSTLPQSLRIGILRGGTSSEYDASIKSGAHVIKNLSETHNVLDIFVDRKGDWYVQGVRKSPEKILKGLDIVFNTLHGFYGEDGTVQDILSKFGAKFVGSNKYPSSVSMNRQLVKDHLVLYGIKTPVHTVVRKGEDVKKRAEEIFRTLPFPLAIKPAKGGSAYGFAVVENTNDLVGVVSTILKNHDSVLVEEYIQGVPASCLVTENFRGQRLYAFPPSSQLLLEEVKVVEEMAKNVHGLLDLSHYSQSDFMISPKRGVFFLEVNTSPKLSEKSLAMKALEKVGVSTREFLHHLIRLGLNRK